MDVVLNKQIPNLKILDLNSLLCEENKKPKNYIKTERLNTKLKIRYFLARCPALSQNTYINYNKTTYNKKSFDNLKKRFNKGQNNLPYLINENKKKSNYFSILPMKKMEGYNNYLKEKTNRAYKKMNKLLMEETINRLSKPKFSRTKRSSMIRKEKSKLSNEREVLGVDIEDEINEKINIEKRHKDRRSLLEKEKTKSRERFKVLLSNNFKELDNCEKKFDIIIDKTLKLLSEYKKSLSYLRINDE